MSDKIGIPNGRFVVTMGQVIVVTGKDGTVLSHVVAGNRSGQSFKFKGSKAAFNQVDRFVVTMGTRLIVITHDGCEFGLTPMPGRSSLRSGSPGQKSRSITRSTVWSCQWGID